MIEQSHSLFDVEADRMLSKQRKCRVGLLYRLTGVPVFLLYLRGIEKNITFSIGSTTEVDKLWKIQKETEDRIAWNFVRQFFEAGGKLAQVCLSPIRGETSSERLKNMIGEDSGFMRRTGFYTLRNSVDRADLVLVPQASDLLVPEDYSVFCQTFFGWIRNQRSFFAVMDMPKHFLPDEAIQWSQSLSSEDAAFYYPWLIRNQALIPASPCIAAEYQSSDDEFHMGENPTNRKIKVDALPLIKLTVHQSTKLHQHRINTLLSFRDSPCLLWGARTLAPIGTSDFQFIGTRRALKGLENALTCICDHFVLEPLRESTLQILQNELDDFCAENRVLFNTNQLKPYQVSVSSHHSSDQEGILVDCHFYLKTCVESLHLSIGVDL